MKLQGLQSYFANLFGENAVARSVVTQCWGLVDLIEGLEHVAAFYLGVSIVMRVPQ